LVCRVLVLILLVLVTVFWWLSTYWTDRYCSAIYYKVCVVE